MGSIHLANREDLQNRDDSLLFVNCLPLCPSVCLFVCLFVCLSVCLPGVWLVCMFVESYKVEQVEEEDGPGWAGD